jgi:hypothetical protein
VAQAGMRQRLRQQKRIAKLITDAFLDRTHRAVILSEVEESLNLLLDCDRISTPRSQNQPDEMIVKRQPRQVRWSTPPPAKAKCETCNVCVFERVHPTVSDKSRVR